MVNYDSVSSGYSARRIPDPRIARAIQRALGGAESVLNIGAGTGSYEPATAKVVAVDASMGMLLQRQSRGLSVQAVAEKLPFQAGSFDAALAILTMHHWQDQEAGLREAVRVARSRIVLLTWIGFPEDFWLSRYIPEIETIDRHLFPSLEKISEVLGPVKSAVVPIPRDCTDGFLCAYWARPEQYLDAAVRAAISTFARIPDPAPGLARLADDLRTGRWHRQYGQCLESHSKDYGYRLAVVEKP